ncbi:MAG: sulfatase-like hydrolase/transferase [bacterium]
MDILKNILLVIVDCLGQFFLEGKKKKDYPFLNSLYSMGVSFSQCVATSTTTTPSVATILTGNYPIRHNIRTLTGARLHPTVGTMAEELAAAGYNTYAEVTGPLFSELGMNRGFLEYKHRDKTAYLGSSWGRELCSRIRDGGLAKPWFLLLHLWELHQPRWAPHGSTKKGRKRVSFEKALQFLDEAMAQTIGNSLNLEETILILTGDHGERVEKSRLDKLLRMACVRAYEKIHPLGLPEYWRTELNRRFRLGHGFHLGEQLIRVPLLLVDCGKLPANLELKTQVSHVDIFPTLAGLLGISMGAREMAGLDLLESWRQGNSLPQRPAFLQASGIVLPESKQWLEGVRWQGFKYIRQMASTGQPFEWLYKVNEGFKEIRVKDQGICSMMREEMDRFRRSESQDPAQNTMSEEESQILAKRLKDLGYM